MDSDVFDPRKEIRKGGQTGEVMLQRQKTCVVHTEATCSRDKSQHVHTHENVKMLRVLVSGTCPPV